MVVDLDFPGAERSVKRADIGSSSGNRARERVAAVEVSDANMIPYLKDHPAAFNPDTIRILGSALDDAWQSIQGGAIFDLDGYAEAARAALAKHIVDMAKKGERDPQRLIEGALIRFRL